MKLRIRDNSVRLRLERGEVDLLCDRGLVSARTGFPGGREFCYALESSPASVEPGASYSDSTLTVRLPESVVLRWANSEQVSIAGEQRLDDGSLLGILVEKDFACLAPRAGEDETDMYPHPGAESREASC
ncbi:MAG: hypothetical protein OEW64_00285 [Gammaproteobacteria bacterium]|nr:hypothetical protein [Gammaproteobacteria bacterium]MDH5302515.1 hypothetical protein [Gammaproteobacteria bacterium]MDH5322299.1 hypothetical protein [Gammaproteobacteria bacterium]